jgi:hypothetical protein
MEKYPYKNSNYNAIILVWLNISLKYVITRDILEHLKLNEAK